MRFFVLPVFCLLFLEVFTGRPAAAGNRVEPPGAAGNAFAFDLHRRLAGEKDGGNLFFSPYSIYSALAMTGAGAAGETAAQLAAALRQPALDETVNPALGEMLAGIAARGTGETRFDTANALWGQQDYSFRPAYLRQVERHYGGKLENVDFRADPEAVRRQINAWVADRTADRIEDLIGQGVLDRMTRLVLTNAVYFLGRWANPFDPGRTAEETFTLAGGEEVVVPMMNLGEDFRYFRAGDVQGVELPYTGGDFSMVVVRPDCTAGLPEIRRTLDAATLERWLAAARRQPVELGLPRFTLRDQLGLETALAAMGIEDAFRPEKADFSGMTGNRELFISAVIHQAFAAVDEEGTEAAAATAVVMRLTSVREPVAPVVFRADQPFLFLIRDRRTGLVLFLGEVSDPRS